MIHSHTCKICLAFPHPTLSFSLVVTQPILLLIFLILLPILAPLLLACSDQEA